MKEGFSWGFWNAPDVWMKTPSAKMSSLVSNKTKRSSSGELLIRCSRCSSNRSHSVRMWYRIPHWQWQGSVRTKWA
jgi:hypothetical protein